MKLKSLKIVNFQSFQGEHVLSFEDPKGLILVLGDNQDVRGKADSNGAGKTTILNAICWALYGQTPSGGAKDKLINHECSEVRVELELTEATVIRHKKRNKSEVLKFRTTGDYVFGDLIDTQRKLEEYLRIDFGTFCNTVFLSRSSNTVDFVRSTPAQRAKVLANLVDDSAFQSAATLVAKDIDLRERSITSEEGRQRQLLRVEQGLLSKKAEIEERLSRAAVEHESKRQQALKEMGEIKQEIDELKLAFSVESSTKLKDLTYEKTVYSKKLDQIIRGMGSRQSLLSRVSSVVSGTSPGESCPTCLRLLDEDCLIHLEQAREDAASELERLGRLEVLARKKIDLLQKEIETALEIDRKKDLAEDKIKQLIREYRLLKDTLQSVSVDHHRQLLVENNREITDLREQQAESNSKVIFAKQEIQQLRVMKRMFQQELRNVLFDRVRTSLEYYTKVYLYQLAGEGMQVLYPPVSKTGAEKFEIILKAGPHEQDLSTFSEGEGWRITIAILFALRRTLLDGRQADFGFTLIDDPIGALDETGAVEFLQTVGRLASESQVLVTLPRAADLRELQYRRLRIVKERGCSSIN